MSTSNELVIVTFKIPLSDLRELDEYCRRANVSRSEVIRRAIKAYMKNVEDVRNEPPIRVRYIRLGDGNKDKTKEVVEWAFRNY